MYFHPNYKDTYTNLCGKTVYLDAATKLESENAVIAKMLSPLCIGKKPGAVSAVCFHPFDESAKEKVISAFGNVAEEKEDAYFLEVTEEKITVYATNVRGYLYGASTGKLSVSADGSEGTEREILDTRKNSGISVPPPKKDMRKGVFVMIIADSFQNRPKSFPMISIAFWGEKFFWI